MGGVYVVVAGGVLVTVLVTVGCTEGIAASLLGVCVPGDEVVVLEPSYDSYGAVASLAGAKLVPVTLRSPEWRLDGDALAAAVTDRTRAMLINSPHNPTGRVLDADERAAVARVAIEHDLIVITDEVYEHLTFDGHQHVPLATMPGMFERTVTLGGAPVSLSTREFDLLHALMLDAGRVLSREQLEQRLYGWGTEVDSNAVEVHVHHLRRKLGPGLIQTVRGVGYLLSADGGTT